MLSHLGIEDRLSLVQSEVCDYHSRVFKICAHYYERSTCPLPALWRLTHPMLLLPWVLYLLYQRMWVNILIGTLPFQFPEVSHLV